MDTLLNLIADYVRIAEHVRKHVCIAAPAQHCQSCQFRIDGLRFIAAQVKAQLDAMTDAL